MLFSTFPTFFLDTFVTFFGLTVNPTSGGSSLRPWWTIRLCTQHYNTHHFLKAVYPHSVSFKPKCFSVFWVTSNLFTTNHACKVAGKHFRNFCKSFWMFLNYNWIKTPSMHTFIYFETIATCFGCQRQSSSGCIKNQLKGICVSNNQVGEISYLHFYHIKSVNADSLFID
jgi:hypothetical protein